VPKNIAKCIKIRQNIEKYCNPKSLIFLSFTGEIVYFVRFLFFPSNLHTVEVTGSNPVSPTIFFLHLSYHLFVANKIT
jgi:hypothetical protein